MSSASFRAAEHAYDLRVMFGRKRGNPVLMLPILEPHDYDPAFSLLIEGGPSINGNGKIVAHGAAAALESELRQGRVAYIGRDGFMHRYIEDEVDLTGFDAVGDECHWRIAQH